MSQSKRRRISAEEQPNVIQSSSPTGSAPVEVINFVPKLDELPKIMMVDLQMDNEQEVEDALQQLWELFATNDPDDETDEAVKDRKEAVGLGMISTLVPIMKKWPENENIQAAVCACLAALVHVKKDESLTVARLGGIEAIVSAMKRFPLSKASDVQECCLRVLMGVLDGHPEAKEPIQDVTKRFVEEFDGIVLASQAMECNYLMELFPDVDDCEAQMYGTGLFCNLSFSGEYRDALLTKGAMSAVTKAAIQHPDDEKIKEFISLFMANMFPVTE